MNGASIRIMLYAWVNGEWEQMTFTGRIAVLTSDTSTIEIQMPRALLGDLPALNIAVLSSDGGRVHTAGNILGTSFMLADWSDALVLDAFFAAPVGGASN